MQKYKLFLVLILFLIPGIIHAQITIADIQANPTQGAKTHQWIQITNDGPLPISLTNWRLVVNGDRHVIKSVSGTTTIPSGASAIITHHPAIYELDYPSYRGLILMSSFTLPNTDGMVSLVDANDSTQISKTYIGTTAPKVIKRAKTKVEPATKKSTVKESKSRSYSNQGTSIQTDTSANSLESSSEVNSSGNGGVAAPPQGGAATIAQAIPVKTSWWPYALGIGTLFSLVIGSTLYSKKIASSEWNIIDSSNNDS